LLAGVEDVRVVVGFRAEDVASEARRHRPDVTIVENREYATTTTLVSYAAGAQGLVRPCLFLDGDILFRRSSFAAFLDQGAAGPVVGYTDAKTDDAVYVSVVDGSVTSFSRTRRHPYEWANVAVLPPRYCEGGSGAVFELLTRDLPLSGRYVDSYEVDRPGDLARASEALRAGWLDGAMPAPERTPTPAPA
jgi:hypothetical protein